jgi:6-phosphofructokinase 1
VAGQACPGAAAVAGLAGGAEGILVPETNADDAHLEKTLQQGWAREKSSIIIVVAEGDESGGAAKVTELIKKYLPGRYIGYCILGHTQRGGCPTSADRILAARLGVSAVNALLSGEKNVMVGMVKGDILKTPLEKIKRHHLQLTPEVLGLLEELAS